MWAFLMRGWKKGIVLLNRAMVRKIVLKWREYDFLIRVPKSEIGAFLFLGMQLPFF